MDEFTNPSKGLDDQQWHMGLSDQIVIRTSAGRNHLNKLFDNLEFYNRQGRRIRNQSRRLERPKISVQTTPKAVATPKKIEFTRKKATSQTQNIFIESAFAKSKRKINILVPIEFEYSMSLEKTKQKSKELFDQTLFTPRPDRLLSSKRRKFKSRQESRSHRSPQTFRPVKRGLDQLCVQTVKAMLFPSSRSKATTPMTNLRRRECQQTLMKRLELLKSCYEHTS